MDCITWNDLHAEACRECGQDNLIFQKVLVNDKAERDGKEEFAQEKFDNCLDRAKTIYMPYYEEGNVIHEKYLNLYALAVANHRSEIHLEDRADEIEVYTIVVQTGFVDGDEMAERAKRSWWAG